MRRTLRAFVLLVACAAGWAGLSRAESIAYRYPVYRTPGDPASGIVRWDEGVADCTIVTSDVSAVTWGAAGAASWYAVTNSAATIKGGVTCRGRVNLILCAGTSLTVSDVASGAAGIATDDAGSFTVYGQPTGEGSLDVMGGTGGAGIGGGYGEKGSHIILNGGDLWICGGAGAPGIGSGMEGSDASDIFVATTLVTKVGVDADELEAIDNDGGDLAEGLSGASRQLAVIRTGFPIQAAADPRGTISVPKAEWIGETVAMTVSSQPGYAFETPEVVWLPEEVVGVSVRDVGEGRYSFTMPSCAVGVRVPFEEIAISNVTVQQRYPWNSKVDITFDAVGVGAAGRERGVFPVLKVTATDSVKGTNFVARESALVSDGSLANGTHHLVWDMSEYEDFKSTNMIFSIACELPPKYCIVDVSSGAKSTSYPVSYVDAVPEGGWGDVHKTTRIALRRIEAGSVTPASGKTIAVDKPYYIGVYPVTQKQYELVTGGKPSYFSDCPKNPVEQVSWATIMGKDGFVSNLVARAGAGFGSPSEAQWQYACRAGTTTPYNFHFWDGGLGYVDDDYLWYGMNASGKTHEVGTASGEIKDGGNAWGLYDMHGNVQETAARDGMIIWGGSYDLDAEKCTSSSWNMLLLLKGSYNLGFRLIRAAPSDAPGESLCGGVSPKTRLDLTAGMREAAPTEYLTYSTEWDAPNEPRAKAVITINDQAITNSGSGTVAWAPSKSGYYSLTHTVYLDGSPVAEPLTAGFSAESVWPAKPVINPPSGTIITNDSLIVTMTCASRDATIHYTTNGLTPTMESQKYKKFRVYDRTTVKAIAFFDDGTPSEMAVAEYMRSGQKIATPVITAADVFTGTKNKVVLSCADEAATIYYTLDGTTPTASSPVYEKPFCVTNTCTVVARAVQAGFIDSDVATRAIRRDWCIGDTMGKPDHTFETGGDKGFVRDTTTSPESMRSGKISDNQKSVLSTVVVGPGTLSFKWKTSCEEDDPMRYEFDHAEFALDGKVLKRLDGVSKEWISDEQRIEGKGEHAVAWRYVKDSEGSEGADCAWVSEYVWKSDYTATQTTGAPVPYEWLMTNCVETVDEYVSYEKVAHQPALNGRLKVWECYVAGVDPESKSDDFTTAIEMKGGIPLISWDPDLGKTRTYEIWGCETLGGEWQCPTNSAHRFFKVEVSMPPSASR